MAAACRHTRSGCSPTLRPGTTSLLSLSPRESCTPRKEPRGSHASRRGRGGKLWRRSGEAGSRGCPRPGSGTRRGGRRSACLQPYLQHPGGHHPAHVGLNVLLHALEVGALGQVALLDGQQVLQHAVVVEQVGVRHGPADRLYLAAGPCRRASWGEQTSLKGRAERVSRPRGAPLPPPILSLSTLLPRLLSLCP